LEDKKKQETGVFFIPRVLALEIAGRMVKGD
jgi:hypothetical protein